MEFAPAERGPGPGREIAASDQHRERREEDREQTEQPGELLVRLHAQIGGHGVEHGVHGERRAQAEPGRQAVFLPMVFAVVGDDQIAEAGEAAGGLGEVRAGAPFETQRAAVRVDAGREHAGGFAQQFLDQPDAAHAGESPQGHAEATLTRGVAGGLRFPEPVEITDAEDRLVDRGDGFGAQLVISAEAATDDQPVDLLAARAAEARRGQPTEDGGAAVPAGRVIRGTHCRER